MCEFISWIESAEGPLFLTDDDLNDKSLRKIPEDDMIGHGAVKAFFGLIDSKAKLVDRETPYPLPPEIVKALRAGKMQRIMEIGGIKSFHINNKGKIHRTDGPAVVWASGTKEWFKNGQRHRTGGPAIVEVDGGKLWFKNGKRHRIGGPAIEWASGDKAWHKNGQLHRIGGPAVEYVDGDKEWWENGQRHRTGGPAIVEVDGHKEWWENGKLIKKEI